MIQRWNEIGKQTERDIQRELGLEDEDGQNFTFSKENIRKYGFAFEGKNVLIGSNSSAPKKSLEQLNIFN